MFWQGAKKQTPGERGGQMQGGTERRRVRVYVCLRSESVVCSMEWATRRPAAVPSGGGARGAVKIAVAMWYPEQVLDHDAFFRQQIPALLPYKTNPLLEKAPLIHHNQDARPSTDQTEE